MCVIFRSIEVFVLLFIPLSYISKVYNHVMNAQNMSKLVLTQFSWEKMQSVYTLTVLTK